MLHSTIPPSLWADFGCLIAQCRFKQVVQMPPRSNPLTVDIHRNGGQGQTYLDGTDRVEKF